MLRKLFVFALLASLALGSSYSWADSGTVGAVKAARGAVNAIRSAPIKAQGKNTNFAGGWHGQLVLASADCSGFPQGFLFRHIVGMSGNAVRISTTHDGVLAGSSRDKGRKILATRGYYVNNIAVGAALLYSNLRSNGSVVDIGFGLALSNGIRKCTAIYRATGIRAF